MIAEHDVVVLTEDVSAEGLRAGDAGTVIHVHPRAEAYEVEFFTLTGQTVAVATVLPGQLRGATRHDITHVRETIGS